MDKDDKIWCKKINREYAKMLKQGVPYNYALLLYHDNVRKMDELGDQLMLDAEKLEDIRERFGDVSQKDAMKIYSLLFGMGGLAVAGVACAFIDPDNTTKYALLGVPIAVGAMGGATVAYKPIKTAKIKLEMLGARVKFGRCISKAIASQILLDKAVEDKKNVDAGQYYLNLEENYDEVSFCENEAEYMAQFENDGGMSL